ncbi:MAG: AEC family transporter [Acutalibacteraceae bacterium]
MFFENMKSAATQVAVLYLMVAVGFICDKAKIYTEKTAKATINLLLYIIGPCLLINSFLTIERNDDTVKSFFVSLALAFVTHFIAIAINIPLFRKNDSKDPVYKFACIYGNTGFMALPLAQAVLGSEGVFYCSNGVIAFNVLTFTHGIKVMQKGEYKLSFLKLILNPGVISVMIGLPLFLLKIKLPYVISQPISLIGSLNTPVAMLIFGTYLSKTNLAAMFTDKKIYLVALLKLIVMPVICICLYALCGIRGTLLVALAITASVPSANNTFMFASKYGKDIAAASQTVALVSFISIITMPVMIAFAQSF